MGGGPTQQQQTVDTSNKTAGKTTTQGQTAGTSAVTLPDYLQSFVPGAVNLTQGALGNLAEQSAAWGIPPETLQGLQATAGGDFLFGNDPNRQAYIDASVRSALPSIETQFGMAGRAGGGLYNTAITQQAQDAYARLFNEERNRQLQAQQLLPGITQMPLQLQSQLAQLAGGLPGQFAPFLGGETTGTSLNKTRTTGSSTGQQVTTTPIQQPSFMDYAIPAALAAASFAVPGAGGVSAFGNILGSRAQAPASGYGPTRPGSGLLGFV